MLHYSGINAAALHFRRRSLAVLCYHRVLGPLEAEELGADPALVTSVHSFEQQMEIIARRFAPVSLSDSLRWLDGQWDVPSRAVLVTFDDGVADTYANAFPVMKRLGIPGVVFLATGFIGSSERQWADVVHEHVSSRSDCATAARVVEHLKRMPSSRRQEVLRGVTDSRTREDEPNLTWEQVEEMALHGFEFGSHTRHHLILPYEPDAVVQRELLDAREDICRRLGRPPVSFAYPDGQFDDRTVWFVAQSGCRAAFTCEEGFASRQSPPHALPRILMHDGISADNGGAFCGAMFLTCLAGTIPRRYRRNPS